MKLMKLKLNKKKLKNLSNDVKVLPANLTPNIAGGGLDAGVSNRPTCANYDKCKREM
jgi:hypothetical protein